MYKEKNKVTKIEINKSDISSSLPMSINNDNNFEQRRVRIREEIGYSLNYPNVYPSRSGFFQER